MDLTKLESEPLNNLQISEMLKKMGDAQIKAQFINITYLTELRKDGHPSIHREPGTPDTAPQDCSHWCLPGVPDTWNELLYAHLLGFSSAFSLEFTSSSISFTFSSCLKRSNLSGPYVDGIRDGTYL